MTKILHIDKDDAIRFLYEEELTEEGCEVIGTSNCEGISTRISSSWNLNSPKSMAWIYYREFGGLIITCLSLYLPHTLPSDMTHDPLPLITLSSNALT